MNKVKGKDWLILIADVVIVNLSYFMALVLRFYMYSGREFFSLAEDYPAMFVRFAPIYTVFCILLFYLERMYNNMWRYAGVNDLNRILRACLITTLFQVVGTIALLPRRMPISYYVMGAVLQMMGVTAVRFLYRLFLVEARIHRNNRKTGKNTLIIGAGEAAYEVAHLMEEGDDYRPVCVLDAKVATYERVMDGLPVYGGVDQMEKVLVQYGIRYVYIADPLLQPKSREAIQQICREQKVELNDSGYSYYLQWDEGVDGPGAPRKEALDGSEQKLIPFSPPDLSEAEIIEVKNAMESGWITTGPRTKLLERRLAAYLESGRNDVDTEQEAERWSNRVVCLSSCTAAEELSLRLLGIREGDEVLVPAYTYTSTASAALHCGATVKFVDIQKDGDPITHMPEMDYDALEAAITPATKVVVVVDLGGVPADYDRVFEIVEKKRGMFTPVEPDHTSLGDFAAKIQRGMGCVAVFADSAHALGGSRQVLRTGAGALAGPEKLMCGRIAHFTSFSFHAVKNFTTAEGGAASWRLPQGVYDLGVTDGAIYRMYQLLSLHGQSKDALDKSKAGGWEYDVVGPWYKCNMTDLMAAIGLRQLDRYPDLLRRRIQILERYDEACDRLGLQHLTHHAPGVDSSNHLYLVRVPGISEDQRNEIITALVNEGVSANVHYKPLPMMSAYRASERDIESYPNSYDYYRNVISLPLHTLLTDADVARVSDALQKAVKPYVRGNAV